MQLPPLGLYIHLPWCERKCPYCDFNSHPANSLPERDYVSALLADLRGDLSLLQGRQVETLFIGGGTPSLFSVETIGALMAAITDLLPLASNLEATIEANPGSAEADKFAGFREAGLNRLSLGIQTFADVRLAALGRVHTSEQARHAIDHAKSAGFNNVNLDLMHGLPGQSTADARTDLRTAIDYGPTHLSWYQLTIEPNTQFYRSPPPLPGEDDLAAIQDEGERLLSASGYRQYEVSAYCRPGYACRHNQNYWTFGDYLGIGAGAHGKITWPDGRVERYNKRRQPASYMASTPGAYTAERRWVPPDQLCGEFMMNALRLNGGVALELFQARTGRSVDSIEAALERLSQQQLITIESGRIAATETGRRFLDTVIAEFFP